jgi:hypothetical protein
MQGTRVKSLRAGRVTDGEQWIEDPTYMGH